MASISTQTTDRKRAKYKVRWREPSGAARSESFTTLEAAKTRKRAVEAQLADATYVAPADGRVPFADYAARVAPTWRDLAPATRDAYGSLLDAVLVPLLDGVNVGQIDRAKVQATVAAIRRQDGKAMAPESVRKAFYVLRRIMRQAVRDRMVEANPCEGIDLPRIARVERTALDRDDVAKLAVNMTDEYRALVYVCGDAGLRIGEALALQWSDVDTEARTVAVRRSVSEAGGALTVKEPKSGTTRRAPLTRRTVDALDDLHARTTPARDALVFPAPRGGLYAPRLFRRRAFDPATTKAGLADVTPHDLRHAAITAWIQHGADPVRASRWAGHTKVAFTLDRYAHVAPTFADDVLDRLDAL